MEPGDVFVVLSDGVIDAESATGERFGTPRVIDVIVSAREGSAEELVAALRQALTIFTGGARPDATDRRRHQVPLGRRSRVVVSPAAAGSDP